jgi:hypothetical protein
MNIYETITNRILNTLESGVIPWRKEWKTDGCGASPVNFATKKPYRGINVLTPRNDRPATDAAPDDEDADPDDFGIVLDDEDYAELGIPTLPSQLDIFGGNQCA